MELKSFYRVPLLCLMMAICVSLSNSSFISDGVFESQASVTGRNLLQAKKPCSVNFEFMNYTTLTKRCKGPTYPPDQCCAAFKDFACPYADEINDLTTDCANTMFSYINIYGNYPPGLFANECKEGKEGLACPAGPPESAISKVKNAGHSLNSPSLWVTTAATFLALAKLF